MESPNTSLQAVEFNSSCLGQAHSNRPGAGPRYKNTEHESIFTVLCITFMVCPSKVQMPNLARLFIKDSMQLAQMGV